MASKNSRNNRGAEQKHRYLDGNRVYPVKYVGHHVGHGNYMAGTDTNNAGINELVRDSAGKPIPYSQIGVIK